MQYAFKWRRIGGEWEIEPKVLQHSLSQESDKLVLEFADGGLREIPRWKECELILGADWRAFRRKQLAKEVNHTLKVEVVKE